MTEVETYILNQPAPAQQVMQHLHRYLLAQPGVTAKLRYRIPFYDRHHWFCYLNPLQTGGVELAFTRANEFPLSQDLLDFRGRKQVAGVVFHHPRDIDSELLHVLVMEALALDEARPYASKRQKKA